MGFKKDGKMKNYTNQTVTIHISYANEMTLYAMEDSLHMLNKAFSLFYEREQIPLSESNKSSPKVVSLSNGSLLVDVVVPVSCALLPIVYDIIKSVFSSKKEYAVLVYETQTMWTDKDNYELSKEVLKEYAVKQSEKSIDDFIHSVALTHIYKKSAIKAKIQNTKYLMMEQNIINTLPISPLKHCSKAHRTQFAKACKALNI